MMQNFILPCLYALVACTGFWIVSNIPKKAIFPAAFGGALGWCAYLLCGGAHSDIFQYFAAALVISVYSEIMARVHKSPVTLYLICSLLPLVPGGGIYYTMEYCINGNTDAFLQTGLHTMAIAGVLALGILLVSSIVRLWNIIHLSRTK